MTTVVAIEAGGTKCVLAWGTGPDDLHDITTIPTTTPEETMPHVVDYIRQVRDQHAIASIGAAFFGPIQLDRSASNYGAILATPKLAWRDFNVVEYLSSACQLPVSFDTDVNAAALAEHYWGEGQDVTDFIYMTVGTGIGCGAMVNGRLLHGAMHPEMGHMLVPQDTRQDFFAGGCPYHQTCLEGLASGPAIQERWQVASALDLPPNHEAWDLEATYLSYGLMNMVCVLSPQRIIMGGGVMKQSHLFPMIREKLLSRLAGYLPYLSKETIDRFVVPPGLSHHAGVAGAIALALLEIRGGS